ncbi:EF-hand domain-containing protein [Streptomyces sp. NPDC086554]|uniref:EF-hand domain-containing protein n=1 Tax=Streptomyces sp. NPDC086554 TaxID=3154864 RepID=UPI00342B76EB
MECTRRALVRQHGQLTEEAFVGALMLARQRGEIADLVRPSVRVRVALVDRDGDGQLTVEEWQRAVEDFYTSAETAGPGSLITGMKG